jgi:dolichyl-phosphate-mannose-protein mannosyltransferase
MIQSFNLYFNLDAWSRIVLQSGVCLGGYLLTYVYHFCVDRTLFLHHYLPSYIFKLFLFVSTISHLYYIARRQVIIVAIM